MSGQRNTMDAGHGSAEEIGDRFLDAADAASNQDQITYVLADDGQPYAAIVPLDVAEHHERWVADVLATGVAVPADAVRGFGRGYTGSCALCQHAGGAHTTPASGEGRGQEGWPRPVLDCQMCPGGKCRTPAALQEHRLESMARVGFFSRRSFF